MNNKGFLGLTVGMLVLIVIGIGIIFGGTTLWLWMLKKTIFYVAGVTMLVFLGLGLWRGRHFKWYLWLIAAGLIVLPYFIDGLKAFTLASIIAP